MELLMIYKISPSPSLPSRPEALWAGGQRGGKKGKTFLKNEREKAEMTHSITRRAQKEKNFLSLCFVYSSAFS